ncbi:hypothetical protein [Cupriavidus campinensis]|uniref:hypothetical protein n=1 Tax=Cupriavidus campinensis TaxID=151783 RepID=UPI0024E1D067|nr:hypothetical protein [Cupriavidus campinensis]
MQQVARGAAEMMKKNPYGDAVSAAGTGAHMALSMAIGGEAAAKVDCTPGLNGCYVKDTAGTTQAAGAGMDSFTGLQNDFYKTTSVGKD